jgi:rhamnosyltransferase
MATEVTILLATYKGAKYIRRQLESILSQTHTCWKLFARDDSSPDSTLDILLEFAEKYPAKIFVDQDKPGNLGAVGNFGYLLSKSLDAEYIMFCDQDDYWMPVKIEKTLQCMQHAQKTYGNKMPLLVHTNFTYADENLVPIKSKEGFHARRLKHLGLANLLVQNPVYGCTVMINNSLAKKVKSIPAIAENHDYWVALVASAFGQIIYLPESTILYRQHTGNISTHFDDDTLLYRFKKIFIKKGNLLQARNNILMAREFSVIYGSSLNTQSKKVLDDFINLFSFKSPQYFLKNIKNGVRKQTFNQTALFYLSVLFLRQRH